MSRKWVLVGSAGAAILATPVLWFLYSQMEPPHVPAELGPPPNVVLISMDTTRPDHLGCYGYRKKTSPNLDALALQGIRFHNARAQAPWTLPSHMALFTSM